MRNSRWEFWALFVFLLGTTLVLTDFFRGRIFAQDRDVYESVRPIAEALDEILENYVETPDLDKLVEGALIGMMNSLDDHSSFLTADDLTEVTQDTEGEFDGIGVTIHLDEDKNIAVYQPFPDSPAAKAGIHAGDLILKVDGKSTKGLSLAQAARLIKGPRGTTVELTIYRRHDDPDAESEIINVSVRRDRIPLESVAEARVLPGGVGYIRVSDFSKTTANEIAHHLERLQTEGMKSLVLDLRWNAGGLLTSSKEVADLFLPKNTLVVYTQGRQRDGGDPADNIQLFTEHKAVLPENFPMVVLVNEFTASSAEIVTGALQYWSRAIIVGQRTYGKGSVQTIIGLQSKEGCALRLTTALYYTPVGVTINHTGIKPDVEAPMTKEQQILLSEQMRRSYEDDPLGKRNQQNHGQVSGDPQDENTVEDTQLARAVELLQEDPVFENLLKKYHKDTSETQVAASEEEGNDFDRLLERAAAVDLKGKTDDNTSNETPGEVEVEEPREPAPAVQ